MAASLEPIDLTVDEDEEPFGVPMGVYIQPQAQPEAQARPNQAASSDQRDNTSCNICMEPFSAAGLHKPACLSCGHIFGMR